MLKKLTVLATSATLGTFTVAELSRHSNVSEATVATVLNRMPDDWFVKSPVASRLRGGQAMRYELTEKGRQGIADSLSRLPTIERLAPAQPPFEMPMGLMAAREGLKELSESPAELVAALRDDVRGNLDWAEAEIRGGGYAENAKALTKQIDEIRTKLRAAPDRAPEELEDSISGEETDFVRSEGWLMVARKRFEYWKRILGRRLPGGGWGEDTTLPRHINVIIGYLGADQGSRELAQNARWALAGAAQMARAQKKVVNITFSQFEAGKLGTAFAPTLMQRSLDASELLLCIDSEVNPSGTRIAIEQLGTLCPLDLLKGARVLDKGYSQSVADFARGCRLQYEPNVADTSSTTWIEQTLSVSGSQISA